MRLTSSNYKFAILILLIFLVPQIIFSDVFFIKGSSETTNAQINLIYTVPINNEYENFTFKIYKYKNFTNGVNKQIISNYNPRISPTPSDIKSYTDELNNQVLQVNYNSINSNITIESNFTVDNEVHITPIEYYYKFPLSSGDYSKYQQYLNATSLCPTNVSYIYNLVQSLVKDSNTLDHAVLRILSWIRSNIQLHPYVVYKSAVYTYLYRTGNHEGILNLALTMLRIAKIPSRFVYGFSMNQSYLIKGQNDTGQTHPAEFILNSPVNTSSNILLQYPKSTYKWIEVYFPNRDWVPFDLTTTYFFLFSNLIKQNVGLDSDSNTPKIVSWNKELPMDIQFYVESPKVQNNLSIAYHYTRGNGQHLFPIFSSSNNNFINSLFNHERKSFSGVQVNNGNYHSISLYPYNLKLDHSKEHIELKASPDRNLYQGIYLYKQINIKNVMLPLLRFNNAREGTIWVEIFRSDGSNPLSGSKVATSNKLAIENLNNTGQYKWIIFPFDHNIQQLEKGRYWITLKYDTKEVILWRGIFGNPYQESFDTYSIAPYQNPTKIYLDLCFVLNGTS